jgi:phosphatidylglycerophosphatase A
MYAYGRLYAFLMLFLFLPIKKKSPILALYFISKSGHCMDDDLLSSLLTLKGTSISSLCPPLYKYPEVISLHKT